MTLQSSASTIKAGPRAADIRRLAPWFHNLHLPDDEQTAPDHPLGDFPSYKWQAIAPHLPHDLAGATVLDIGCNAGFYAIELAKRNARVFAIDHDPHYLQQADWAAQQFKVAEQITTARIDVYELARPQPQLPQRFDLVLFLGVLYHLRYPMLGLDIVASRTQAGLVFQTLTLPEPEIAATPGNLAIHERRRMTEPGWPRAAFIENQLADDPTNWWAFNPACCQAMLRAAGFTIETRCDEETWICRKTG